MIVAALPGFYLISRAETAAAAATAVATVVVQIVTAQPHLGQPRRLRTTYRDRRPTAASVTPLDATRKRKERTDCLLRTAAAYVPK